MKFRALFAVPALLVLAVSSTSLFAQTTHPANDQPMPNITIPGAPPVLAPPDALFERFTNPEDRDVARKFYKKYIDVKGLPVMASGDVADIALQRTYYIVTHVLAGRPDILDSMVKNGTRLIIIGKDQVYTDMPDYRHARNPAYQNERVRGTGGFDVTSFGEENLLNLPLDRYDDESIGVHEFCHTVDAAISRIDPTWRQRLRATYQNAVSKGRWHNAYTGSNQAEYWAEICQSYFDCNRINNWNHANVFSREQLAEYDPEGYELCRTTFNFTPETDWRYTPVQKQPSVIPPPGRFKVDPYYTKFTWAREFVVVGSSKVSDEALLKANDTIRKMFAYRHDILKALINNNAKLVILAPGEKLSDLPEFKDLKTKPAFDDARYYDYTEDLKTIVVPEESILGLPREPFLGESAVVRAFARALYTATCLRPVDPDWDHRPPQIWQQYELRQKRLDVTMDENIKKFFDAAAEKKLWRGTPAANDHISYWAAGVEAYFDAAGSNFPPFGGDRPINTRELLKAYDPDLYALVDQTMSYTEHADWRYKPYKP